MARQIIKLTTAVIDRDAMGVELSWAFGYGNAEDVTIPRTVIEAILASNGFLTTCLETLDPSDALKRAAKLAPSSKGISVKELARPNSDSPRVYGIYTRGTVEGESGDTWTMGARVRAVGDEVVSLPPEGKDGMLSIAAAGVAQTMERQANELLRNAFNQDISCVLVSIGQGLGWISRRRNSGGVYYMPSGANAERFVKLLLDIQAETASHHASRQFVPEILEVFPRPLTQATIADAATHHFEVKINTLVDQLRAAADTGKMRESTMGKRVDEIDALIVQAEEYRSILAEGATELKARLDETRRFFMRGLAGGCDALSKEFAAFDRIAPPAPKAVPAPAAPTPEPTPAHAPVVEADPFDFLDA